MLKNIRALTLISVLTVSLAACGPRGENNSVEQVLKTKQDSYFSFSKAAAVDAGVSTQLEKLNGQLDAILKSNSPQTVNAAAKDISESLSELIMKAGFTTRPALTEIVNQYRALADQKEVQAATVKLLAARTYSLLASELETTKFAL